MKPLSGILGDAVDTEPKAPSALSGTLAPAAKPVSFRDFGDIDKMRQAISSNISGALSSSYPLENSRYRLELKNIKYLDSKGISWIVWCFDPEWGPTLISDWNYTLNSSGLFAKAAMAGEIK